MSGGVAGEQRCAAVPYADSAAQPLKDALH